jgi:soluble lytic murein transglycosylase
VCLLGICIAAVFLRTTVLYRIYPLDYEEEIAEWSRTYTINEYLVCAVICAESRFDETAVSPKGAVGLMQIMPDTGEWAAGKIGIEGYSDQMLTDPNTNIRIGCWYLSYLDDKFSGDARKVLAAYNAGPANVQEWLETDEALENIPFEETENYLERVQRNYEIYKGLYDVF